MEYVGLVKQNNPGGSLGKGFGTIWRIYRKFR